MSTIAEKVLEETIQENTKGDLIYFWGCLNVDGGPIGNKDALTFWSMCDILNGGNCRYIVIVVSLNFLGALAWAKYSYTICCLS